MCLFQVVTVATGLAGKYKSICAVVSDKKCEDYRSPKIKAPKALHILLLKLYLKITITHKTTATDFLQMKEITIVTTVLKVRYILNIIVDQRLLHLYFLSQGMFWKSAEFTTDLLKNCDKRDQIQNYASSLYMEWTWTLATDRSCFQYSVFFSVYC